MGTMAAVGPLLEVQTIITNANSSNPIAYSAPSNDVRFTRPELFSMIPQYDLIRDCIAGEHQVKFRAANYLPMPNPTDKSPENLARFANYIRRAVFYNATGRTQKGMVGQVFGRDPVVELPPVLEKTIHKDCDGTGLTLEQAAKKTVGSVIAYGRAGLFVDYPTTDHATTVKQLAEGDIKPVILHYDPWQIRNWRYKLRGSRLLPSLVVLMEPIQVENGDFGLVDTIRYRVLRIDPITDTYAVELWLEKEPASGQFQLDDMYIPTDSTGKPLDEIPFTFIGAENNDQSVDEAPMYDLAVINIAHYRNSADHEETCFVSGQPTIAVIGLDQNWLDNVLKGQVVMGAVGGIPLPPGADVKIIQPNPNTLPKEAMEQKELQMVHLGARIAEAPSIQKTATQSAFDESSETSVLASTSGNVSAAYLFALQKACLFTGDDPASMQFNLNKEFDVARMNPDDRRETIAEWQSEAISFTEMRTRLRRAGVVTQDDDEAKSEILADRPVFVPLAIDQGTANVNAGGGPGNKPTGGVPETAAAA